MPAISAIFLVASLALAVLIGPQIRPWTWGPAMLALGISLAAAVPSFWNKQKVNGDFGLVALGIIVASWFVWRAWSSPVVELGQADLLLLAGAVGAFISIRGIEGNALAERILIWGVALLLLANVIAIGKQVVDPSFSPIFRARASEFPSGFYAHYNEAANYLIASSLLVAAAALFGNHSKPTRIVWGVVAIAGLTAVYFTHSRGGILGAAVGSGVFMIAALVMAKRTEARWFAPALIAIPVLGLLIGGFIYLGWEEAQAARNIVPGDNFITRLLDSDCRLYFLGFAVSCIALHPLMGGGSRSFSWECLPFADFKSLGYIAANKPEQVHNELLQAATDYGLIGAGLLICLLVALVIVVVVRILLADRSQDSGSTDAWRIGGLAALAGMFVQSSFSFVFHLIPGVILLGICLGQMARSPVIRDRTTPRLGSKILLSLAAITSILWLIPRGWNGTRVTHILWPSYFSKTTSSSPESKVAALTDAIAVWPVSEFYSERAKLLHTAAASQSGGEAEETTQKAIQDYQKAGNLHPYDPAIQVNLANLLSKEAKNTEAEEAYDRAIRLQGGMETAFQARYFLATHLLGKAQRQFTTEDPAPTLATLEIASQQMERSVNYVSASMPDLQAARVAVHENLGAAREANGDYPGAVQAYDFASTLPTGSKAHYRTGLLLGKRADAAWRDRKPSEALTDFIEAKRRIGMASELPGNFTPSQRLEYSNYLDRSIEYLKGAKVVPTPTQPK